MDVDARFRTQYGLITRPQARASGLTDRQIDRRLATGAWDREHPGVFRLSAVPTGWHSRLLGPVLNTGGVASHRSAAALWYLEIFRDPVAEISVPTGRWAQLDGVRIHHTTQWATRDEKMIGGIACTNVERSILDCGAVASERTVERLAEAAIRKRLTTWQRLLTSLRVHSVQGRDGCLDLRRVLERRLLNRTIPLSDFSRLVANLLVDGGVPEPVVEYRIVDSSGDLIMQADLAWPGLKKAWELDGLQFHFGRTEIERDRRKRNRAKSRGWNIQEILWSMYLDEPNSLVTMAHEFLSC